MQTNLLTALAMPLLALCPARILAADFDGDGAADEFTITRDAAIVARRAGIHTSDPWRFPDQAKTPPKGLGFILRLTHPPQTYLLHGSFLTSPMWTEKKPPVEVITKKDRRYRAWKKQVPGLRGDALQVGTEAGIDILLYWDGKRWSVFWPDESP
jgi:hypothetical protein